MEVAVVMELICLKANMPQAYVGVQVIIIYPAVRKNAVELAGTIKILIVRRHVLCVVAKQQGNVALFRDNNGGFWGLPFSEKSPKITL